MDGWLDGWTDGDLTVYIAMYNNRTLCIRTMLDNIICKQYLCYAKVIHSASVI